MCDISHIEIKLCAGNVQKSSDYFTRITRENFDETYYEVFRLRIRTFLNPISR